MGKFKNLLDEAEVSFGDKKLGKQDIKVPRTGKELSPAMKRLIQKSKELSGQSGHKLRKSIESIIASLEDFQKALKNLPKGSDGYDSVKYKIRNNFEKAILALKNMAADVKRKGLKAVENKNGEMELWESLENSCENTISLMRNL